MTREGHTKRGESLGQDSNHSTNPAHKQGRARHSGARVYKKPHTQYTQPCTQVPVHGTCPGMINPYNIWLWKWVGLTAGEMEGCGRLSLLLEGWHAMLNGLRPSKEAAVWKAPGYIQRRFTDQLWDMDWRGEDLKELFPEEKGLAVIFLAPPSAKLAGCFMGTSLTLSIYPASTMCPAPLVPWTYPTQHAYSGRGHS